jgi:predicted molibdopterin-dependent oxidoreductase YjgC
MSRRIIEHPILEYDKIKGKEIRILFNGEAIKAYEDEPIAAAILAAGFKVFRKTPKLNRPRGIFCANGRCTDCIMTVDGVPSVRTCITPAKDGMIVASQDA